MVTPSVSVVIPSLNSSIIQHTLAALSAQAFDLSRVEVVVVGLDQPGLVRSDSLVRFISTRVPATPAVARNIGVRETRGDLICFTDADCLPAPDWLARLTAPFEDPATSVVGGGVIFDTDNYWTLCDNLSWFHEYLAGTAAGEREQLPTLNLCLRRCILDRVGLLDERYPTAAGEDAEWTVRMRQRGYTLRFVPEAVVRHCPARGSLTTIWRHGYTYGYYSLKVNPAYASFLGTPALMSSSRGVWWLTPWLAAWASLRIFRKNRKVWPYWYTAPGLFVTKVAWCLGAARALKVRETASGESAGGNAGR